MRQTQQFLLIFKIEGEEDQRKEEAGFLQEDQM